MDLRPHPLYIWYDARKWIWLLLIPVLRALFSPRDAVYILLSSIRDVGIALLLIGYSALKWRGARYPGGFLNFPTIRTFLLWQFKGEK